MSKKGKILDTALHLFAKQGVDKTSTSEITKKAGVAEGTLFVHFKNKQALVDEVYRTIKQKEAEAFSEVLDAEEDVETNVRTLSKTIVEHFIENYDELLFIQHATQLGLVSKKTVTESKDYFEEIHRTFTGWQKEGSIKSLDCTILNAMIWSMLVSLVHHCKCNKKKVTSKMIDPLWDALIA